MHELIAKLRESYVEALRLRATAGRVEWIPWDDWDRRWLFARDVRHGVSFVVPPRAGGAFALIGYDGTASPVIAVAGPEQAFREAIAVVALDGATAAHAGGDQLTYDWPEQPAGKVGGGHNPPNPQGGDTGSWLVAADLARVLLDTVGAFRSA